MKYKYNEYRVEEQEQYKTSTIYAQDKSGLLLSRIVVYQTIATVSPRDELTTVEDINHTQSGVSSNTARI